jgi:hypothetical protein
VSLFERQQRKQQGKKVFMSRNSLGLAVVAFVIVAATSAVQLFGLPLAPLAALALGALAGWWVAANGEGGWRTALRAGAVVGVGALVGAVAGLAVPALIAGSLPDVQEFVQASEPHPEARIPTAWIAPLAGLGGVLGGLILGIGDLALAAIGAVTAAALRSGSRPAGT